MNVISVQIKITVFNVSDKHIQSGCKLFTIIKPVGRYYSPSKKSMLL